MPRRSIPTTIALLVVAVVTGCSTEGDEPPGRGATSVQSHRKRTQQQPNNPYTAKTLRSAVRAAQEFSDRYASNRFDEAYDLMSSRMRKRISDQTYEAIQRACFVGQGPPVKVVGDRVVGDTAHVRYTIGGAFERGTLTYEAGAWWVDPTTEEMTMSPTEQIEHCRPDLGND